MILRDYIGHIWLDDMRTPPDSSYIWVKDYDSFVNQVKALGESVSSYLIHFDHDLGLEKSGYDCAKWLIDWCIENEYNVPDYDIQSANPVGRKNIESLFETYWKCFFGNA